MKIVIVDYRAGNLTSVKSGFEAIGAEATITDQPEIILAAERVVFPGVGSARAAMASLKKLGLDEALRKVVARRTPFLGICLGTQIIFDYLEEDGGVAGLGFIPGTVKRFTPLDRFQKVPQIGWNSISFMRKHPVFEGIANGSEFYFVHSYYPAPTQESNRYAETEYGGVSLASVVGNANIIATQFHPEKSGRIGLKVLQNFVSWDGTC